MALLESQAVRELRQRTQRISGSRVLTCSMPDVPVAGRGTPLRP